ISVSLTFSSSCLRPVQRLKAALHFTVGRLCEDIGGDGGKRFNKEVLAAIAETTYRQCDIFAKDLEAFARYSV
uniref:Centromere protein S n=1 Tax=Scleropages formosus TaxID=113540 RepID=A0A8C9VXA5_SCLFO